MTIHETEIEVVRGSVLEQDVDAVVNAANTSLRGGGGVDGAIHRAAGAGLMEELIEKAPHGAKTGTVVVTTGHRLAQRYVLHTPGPVWNGGGRGEADLLASCYRNCLEAADGLGIARLAFCSISTGVYGYPLAQAAPLAVGTVIDWLTGHSKTTLRRVVFAMYGETEYTMFSEALQERENV